MSYIAAVNNYSVEEASALNRDNELRNIMLSFIKFDTRRLDTAKIIYHDQKDDNYPYYWYGVIGQGMGLMETHRKIKFNAKITMAIYSKDLEKYKIVEHALENVEGGNLVSDIFNHFTEIDFADIVRIDAVSSPSFGKRYKSSCVFVQNLR